MTATNQNGPQIQDKNPIKTFFAQDFVKEKFKEVLGKNPNTFITSILQIIASNDKLKNADPISIFNAAAVAATLNLPLNNNLGFAYIIPYKTKRQRDDNGQWEEVYVAQFQLGYKGFKQLALRSGQFLTITATDVRDGELKHHNRLTGEMDFVWIQNSAERLESPVVGFVSYFKLLNGYEQSFYMTIEELKHHGAKYSKNFKNSDSLWKTDEDGMCSKTVIKLNLSKNAPLSIELQTAIKTDQALINDPNADSVSYIDNEIEKVKALVSSCKTIDELSLLQESHPDIDVRVFNIKKALLMTPGDKKDAIRKKANTTKGEEMP